MDEVAGCLTFIVMAVAFVAWLICMAALVAVAGDVLGLWEAVDFV